VAFDFRKLVDFSNVVICAQYVATCASIPFLRRKLKAAPGSFRLPAGVLIPLIGCAATLWLGFQGGITQVWWFLGILAAGFAFKIAYHASATSKT
jgi:amino acid transporter